MKKRLVLIYCFFSIAKLLYANPINKEVVYGKVDFSTHGRNLEIVQKSDRAIIHWDEFSIGPEETTCFIQPRNGVVLNRVTGDFLSKIDGTLQANAKVYLINEKGITIGVNGKIQTKGFFASCYNLLDQEFLSSETLNLQGNNENKIKNHGLIEAEKESVVLVAREIENHGLIRAPYGIVGLIGASDVLLTEKDQKPLFIRVEGKGRIHNTGKIEAIRSELLSGVANMFSFAINQEGIIEATEAVGQNGRIILSAKKGEISISGKLLANSKEQGGVIQIEGGDQINIKENALLEARGLKGGGEILIGGDFQGENPNIINAKRVYVAKEVNIKADAIQEGNGGKVIVWAQQQNLFGGNISARGGRDGGDGGFVEVSSPHDLLYQGSCTTLAFQGKTGNLLLDPSDIVISTRPSNPTFPTSAGEYNPTSASAILNATNLIGVGGLATTNVTISTNAGSGGNGTVTFATDVIWATGNTLTVQANRNIVINPNVTISSTNAVAPNFLAIDFQANQEVTPVTGNFDGILLNNATISSLNGTINLLARGGTANNNCGINITESTISSTGVGIEAGLVTLNGTGGAGVSGLSGVLIQSNSLVTTTDGNVSITGSSNGSGNYNNGIHITQNSIVRSIGNILTSGTVTLDGTGSSGVSENSGVRMETNATVTSILGNIDITANSNGTDDYNSGLNMNSASTISSTGLGINAATMTIGATSGTGMETNRGGVINNNSTISSIDGNVVITPISRGIGTRDNHGLLLNSSQIISTGDTVNAADITINATRGGGSGTTGVRGRRGTTISTITGNLNITGGFLND